MGQRSIHRRGLRRQLRNCEYYQPLKSDPTERIRIELTDILTHAKTEGWILQNEIDFFVAKSLEFLLFICCLKCIKL